MGLVSMWAISGRQEPWVRCQPTGTWETVGHRGGGAGEVAVAGSCGLWGWAGTEAGRPPVRSILGELWPAEWTQHPQLLAVV